MHKRSAFARIGSRRRGAARGARNSRNVTSGGVGLVPVADPRLSLACPLVACTHIRTKCNATFNMTCISSVLELEIRLLDGRSYVGLSKVSTRQTANPSTASLVQAHSSLTHDEEEKRATAHLDKARLDSILGLVSYGDHQNKANEMPPNMCHVMTAELSLNLLTFHSILPS
ncbi:hypothetical protein ACJJTC_004345 [Scirpophaga incertulas]